MTTNELVIAQTKKWITDVVVACNFCPFAAKEIKQNTIYYQVETSTNLAVCLQAFLNECIRLDEDKKIETSLLIFTDNFKKFTDYLELVELAEKVLKQEKYEGIYQVASFHPEYCFANAPANDPANYTNRSIYPMLHLLREDRVEEAILRFGDADKIPERNIHFTREKGYSYMKLLKDSCL